MGSRSWRGRPGRPGARRIFSDADRGSAGLARRRCGQVPGHRVPLMEEAQRGVRPDRLGRYTPEKEGALVIDHQLSKTIGSPMARVMSRGVHPAGRFRMWAATVNLKSQAALIDKAAGRSRPRGRALGAQGESCAASLCDACSEPTSRGADHAAARPRVAVSRRCGRSQASPNSHGKNYVISGQKATCESRWPSWLHRVDRSVGQERTCRRLSSRAPQGLRRLST